MADFLTAVKSVRPQQQNQVPSAALTAVKSITIKANKPLAEPIDSAGQSSARDVDPNSTKLKKIPRSGLEILDILRSQPDHTEQILRDGKVEGCEMQQTACPRAAHTGSYCALHHSTIVVRTEEGVVGVDRRGSSVGKSTAIILFSSALLAPLPSLVFLGYSSPRLCALYFGAAYNV